MRPESSSIASIDPKETPEKLESEHEDLGNEKGQSVESLYQPGGRKAKDSESEHASESQQTPATRTVSEVHDGIESRRDVEMGAAVETQTSAASWRDPNLVTWEVPDDPQNPKTWSLRRKWAAVIVGKQQTSKLPGL